MESIYELLGKHHVHAIHADEDNLRITALPIGPIGWIFGISDSDEVLELNVRGAIYDKELLNRGESLNLSRFDEICGKLLLFDVDDHTEFEIKGKIEVQKRWYNKEEILHLAKEAYQIYSHKIERLHKVENTLNKAQSFVVEAQRRSEIKHSAGKKINIFDLLKQISTILLDNQ